MSVTLSGQVPGSVAPAINPYPPVSATRRNRKPSSNPFNRPAKTPAVPDGSHSALTPFDTVVDTFLANFGWHVPADPDGDKESSISASIKSAEAMKAAGNATVSETDLLEPANTADRDASRGYGDAFLKACSGDIESPKSEDNSLVDPSDEALLHAAMNHEGDTVIDAMKVPLVCGNVVAERMVNEIEAASDGKHASEGEEKADEDTPPVNVETSPNNNSVRKVIRKMAKDPQKRELLKQVVSLAHDRFAFPIETQIPVVQRIIRETSESLDLPHGTPAFTLLMLIGCIVGRSYELFLKADWKVPGNLWGCLIAPKSMRKSALTGIILGELANINTAEVEEWHKLDQEYRKNSQIYAKAAAKAAKLNEELSVEKPERPKRVQHMCEDISIYALAEAMQDNPRGMAQVIDEVGGLLNTLAHDIDIRCKYLSAYSSKEWLLSRKQVHIHVPHACLSIFGGIQTKVLSRLAVAFEDDGLLDRFLFLITDRSGPNMWTDKSVSPEVNEIIKELTHRLVELPMDETPEGKPIPNVVHLTPEAREMYIKWFNTVALDDWTGCYPGRLVRFREQAAKIVLNLHIAEAVLTKSNPLNPISNDTMKRALAIADWLKEHQLMAMELMLPVHRFNGWTLRQAVLCSLAEAEDKIKAAGGKIAFKNLSVMVAQKIHGFDDSRELRKAIKELNLPSAQNCPEVGGKRGRGYFIADVVMEEAKATMKKVMSAMKAAANTEGEND